MGTSTNAMLLYGYHLGSDDGWLLEGVGEYGELPELDWFDPNAEDEYGQMLDFIMAAERHLLAEIGGFAETDRRADGYYDRKRAAEALVGVELESHCSGEYPMWVLCAKRITAYRGDVHEIDPVELSTAPPREGWDVKLAAAVEALDIRPKQPRPAWLLCSYWG